VWAVLGPVELTTAKALWPTASGERGLGWQEVGGPSRLCGRWGSGASMKVILERNCCAADPMAQLPLHQHQARASRCTSWA